jgi:hypothetical protein
MHYWTIQSTVMSFLMSISLGWGFGSGDAFGRGGDAMACMSPNTAMVLAAAPLKTTFMVPVFQAGSVMLAAPPEYSNVTFLNKHFRHTRPSSWTTPLANSKFSTATVGNGGTFGIQLSDAGLRGALDADACIPVEVYMNHSVEQAPSMKNPNAEATLFITPPLSNNPEDCIRLRYHYGKPTEDIKDNHSKGLPPAS